MAEIIYGQQLLPILGRAREQLEEAYAHIITAASGGAEVPCALFESYRIAVGKLRVIERRVVDLMRAHAGRTDMKIVPPDDAPQPLPVFGACTPGEVMGFMAPDVQVDAQKRVQLFLKRRHAADAGLKLLWERDEKVFRPYAARLLQLLAPLAKAGTDETLPPPGNVGLLKLLFWLGGPITLWTLPAVEAVRTSVLPIDPEEALAALREAEMIGKITTDLRDAYVPPEEPKKSNRLPIIAGVAGALGTAGIGTLVWWLDRRERADSPFAQEMLPDDPGLHALPPVRRKRRKRRKPVEAPAHEEEAAE